MKSQVKVDTTGPMARPIKDSGRRTKCMETVSSCGRTERGMKVTLSMISAKVKELSSGLMADAISEDGEPESKTVKELTLTRKTRLVEVSGRMAARFNGLTEEPLALMTKWTASDIFLSIALCK